MKKLTRLAMMTFVLLCVLCITALASNYDGKAQELKSMGLFQGTDAGFDLDREPSRTEAAVMLVRMLGTEAEARAEYSSGGISHPFADVPGWADAYIAWLYQNGLANGVSDTRFGASELCSTQMYCTFVLRALGYSDKADGDFTFSGAEDYAREMGIYSDEMSSGDTFLRDDAVAVSYNALGAKMKTSDSTLLDSLVASGAVSQESAQPVQAEISVYRSYMNAIRAYYDLKALDMSMDSSMAFQSTGMDLDFAFDLQYDYKFITTENDIQMECIATTTSEGEVQNVGMWFQDGYLYTDVGGVKTKTAVDPKDASGLIEAQGGDTEMPENPLCQIDSITATETSDGILYSITFSGGNGDMQQEDQELVSLLGLSIDHFDAQVLVGKNGMISSVHERFAFTMISTDEDETAASLTCNYEIDMTVNAVGDDVTIDFPDFSEYSEN